MLVDNKYLLQKAKRGKYAVGAFNFSTIEILQGILDAAQKQKSPIIVSTSQGEAAHFGIENACAIVHPIAKRSKLPMALHLDHGKDLDVIKQAIKAGYPSVHVDASALEYKDNVKLSKKVVSLAAKRGVSVEAELGHIYGGSSLHKDEGYQSFCNQKLMTDPEQAKDFVQSVGCDALAVAIGNAHGIYKGKPKLDFKRLEQISKSTKIPIVLHGGSGIPDSDIKKAISLGVSKINVNSEMRVAFADSISRVLKKDPNQSTPYKILGGARQAVSAVVEKKISAFMSRRP